MMDKVFRTKVDAIKVGFDNFLAKTRLLKSDPKIIKIGQILVLNGSHMFIINFGIIHKICLVSALDGQLLIYFRPIAA